MIHKNAKIVITGGAGFLGKQVVKKLEQQGYINLFIPRSKNFDLRKSHVCQQVIKGADALIHLAATVGGIGFNQQFPATLFYDNLLMGLQVLHESHRANVKKFVAIGTICAYPKYTPVPFREDDLWNGYPEETNAPYGLAKKMLLVGAQAYRKQFGFNAIYLLPVNMYGPEDNFDPQSSHVIPALIRKIVDAKRRRLSQMTAWGSGTATREFLYVEDAASAIVSAFMHYDLPDPVNIGTGQEISIYYLATLICQIVGYQGKIIWDKTKPDGQPRRLLSIDKAFKTFGFRAQTSLTDGLKKTIMWYKKYYAS